MIQGKEDLLIRLKFGIVFSMFLEEAKSKKEAVQDKKSLKGLNTSFGELSSHTGLRAATLTDIFSGRSNPKATSVILILESFGKSFEEFGKYFDNISNEDIKKFKDKIKEAKINRINKKENTPLKKKVR